MSGRLGAVPGLPPLQRRRLGLGLLVLGTAAVIVGVVEARFGAATFGLRPIGWWTPWVAGSGAAVWLGAHCVERWRGGRLQVATALLCGLALAAVLLHAAGPLQRAATGNAVRSWNVFHYYVGSKYFAELGYTDLYAATLAADSDWRADLPRTSPGRKQGRDRGFGFVTHVRDQVSGDVGRRAAVVAAWDATAIDPARLAELGADTRFLRRYLSAGGWKNVLRDLGYNPAPPWTIVGAPLANAVPTRWPWFWIITNGDLLLFVLTGLLLWWAAGARVTAAAVLWTVTFEVNFDRFSGGFLQYDWFASTLIAGAFLLRGRHGAAGIALSWGAMTRVFPGFLVLPFFIQAGRALLERRTIDPAHRRFLVAFAVSCAVLFAGSHLTGRGLATWPEWVTKISRHSHEHAITSNRRVGVGRLAQHAPTAGAPWGERQGTGPARLEAAKPMRRALQVLGLLLLLPALWHRDDRDGFALAHFLVVIGVVLSRYYASTWALLFLLAAPVRGSPGADRAPTPWLGVVAGAGLLLLSAVARAPGEHTGNYFLINWGIYVLMGALCLGALVGDVRAGRFRRARGGSAQ